MRFVMYGAGAVGGVIGARLHQAGHDVMLIARGEHYAAIRDRGLQLDSADGAEVLPIPVVGHPNELDITAADVIVLGMKTQHTQAALDDLVKVAPPATPIVCAQNGVENERLALRQFPHVYGLCVICPTGHIEPGVVEAHTAPITGLLDIGCYPTGIDATAREIAAALSTATFESIPRDDVMAWKYAKLLTNLANAVNAVCRSGGESGALIARARAEGEAALRAAGIAFISSADDEARRGNLLQTRKIDPARPRGGSTWQSLYRGAGTIETDYLNGEIVLLGRQHGVATPVNELLQRLCTQFARERRPPSTLDPAELLASVDGSR